MAILDRIRNAGAALMGSFASGSSGATEPSSVDSSDNTDYGQGHRRRDTSRYRKLEAYYRNDRVYERLAVAIRTVADKRSYSELKSLRNPAERVVEFHATTLWGGQPEDVELKTFDGESSSPAANESPAQGKLASGIRTIWKWSNLNERGRVMSRWLPLYGDLLLKVAKPDGRDQVVIQAIKPLHLTDFEKDDRGYFTFLRLDIPFERMDETGKLLRLCHTEIWRKGRDGNDGRALFYEHEGSAGTPEYKLPEPVGGGILSSANPNDQGVYGFDFIPFVHAKFRDIGDERGIGVFEPYTDMIDEANRMATRSGEIAFRYNRAYRALESQGVGPDGAPMPAPRVDQADRQQAAQAYAQAGYEVDARQRPDEITLGGEKMALLPSNVRSVDLSPTVDLTAFLDHLSAHLEEMSQQMPEILYYKLGQIAGSAGTTGTPSGVALRTLIAGAIDRAKEARGNLFSSLERADEMALTMAQVYGVDGYSATDIGTFEAGDFEHTISAPEILPDKNGQIDRLIKLKQLGAPDSHVLAQAGVPAGQSSASGQPNQDVMAQAQQALSGLLNDNGSNPAG